MQQIGYIIIFEGDHMTFDEVKNHFGTAYRFKVLTGMSHSNFKQWSERGYIPIETQLKIEMLTKGLLKADLSHCPRLEKDVEP